MKRLIFIVAITTSVISFAQNSVNEILKQYGFKTENVFSILDNSKSNYSFNVKGSSHTYSDANKTDKTTNRVYHFDNNKTEGQKFSLISVEGSTPTKRQIKHFNKEKNKISESEMKLTEKDFFVKTDDEKMLVIGFNMPKEELPSKIAFMSHCTGFLYIDKQSEKITKIEIKSKEAFSMKIFHITELNLTVSLAYNDDKNLYYITKEETNTKVLILGSITNIDNEEIYSDFTF